MTDLFKDKTKFIINSFSFDEYRKVENNKKIDCKVNESISDILFHKNLDSLMITSVTTMTCCYEESLVVVLVLKSSLQISLKEKLIKNDKGGLNFSEENKVKASNMVMSENRKFINDFLKNTKLNKLKLN